MHPSPSWLFRFLARLPELPDWFSPVLLLLAVFVAGFACGGTYVAMKRVPEPVPAPARPSLGEMDPPARALRLLLIEHR